MLWTNSNPTNNFVTQTVTLSDAITNYDYIKIVVLQSTDDATEYSTIVKTSDFITSSLAANSPISYSVYSSSTGYRYARIIYYVSDTSVGISSGFAIHRDALNNSLAMPYQIIGIK